jgi:cell division protein FtsA
VIHVIPRTFTVDGQDGIRNPLGLHAYRLEVEAHIITAGSSSLLNLEKCINDAGLSVDRFVLNPLASGESVLTDAERESGVVVVDIGGGTTDIAVFIEGTVWHTAVIEVGGNHITNDIAHVLHLPVAEAERVKIDHGNSMPETVDPDTIITIQPFGEDMPTQLMAHDLSQIIEARVDEIFTLVVQELKRSGYDGLLPAGIVLTGGTALLRNIRHNASGVLHMPARVAYPQHLTGLKDKLESPMHATGAGLLHFARRLDTGASKLESRPRRQKREGPDIGKALGDFFGRLLPDE